jgi:hypothetical protein
VLYADQECLGGAVIEGSDAVLEANESAVPQSLSPPGT